MYPVYTKYKDGALYYDYLWICQIGLVFIFPYSRIMSFGKCTFISHIGYRQNKQYKGRSV